MNEEEYTQTIVVPLLRHLGYVEVTYNHGIVEFGKDVLFSEYDRFGNKIYNAAQVKAGDISGGNTSGINDLVDHIVNAFNIDFPDLITQDEVAICHFFVITSGRFIGNAPKKLLSDKRLHLYRHRMHFYEGDHITAFFEKSLRDIKELCVSALNEIQYNTQLALTGRNLLVSGEVLYAGYAIPSLDKLTIKLALLQESEPLANSLRNYRLLISRNNNLINWLPVLSILRGAEQEKKALLEGIEAMLRTGDEMTRALKQKLADMKP